MAKKDLALQPDFNLVDAFRMVSPLERKDVVDIESLTNFFSNYQIMKENHF